MIKIDANTTFANIFETLKNEDPTIQSYEVLNDNMEPWQDTSLKVLEFLEDPAQTYFLKLNDRIYGFDSPTLDVQKEAEVANRSKLVNVLMSNVKTTSSENTMQLYRHICLFLANVDQIIDGSKKEKFSPAEVTSILSAYAQDVQNSPAAHHRVGLARRHIYQLYLKKIQIQKTIGELEAQKAEIDKSAQFKTNLLFSSIFVTCLIEFCVGYYCIYEVDWLGWDLVEPLTYTLGQGKFVLGTWFFCKYLSDTNCTDLNSFFNNRFKYRMYKKKLFEFQRLNYLKKQVLEIEDEIREVERNILY